jgi:hypothetical protein
LGDMGRSHSSGVEADVVWLSGDSTRRVDRRVNRESPKQRFFNELLSDFLANSLDSTTVATWRAVIGSLHSARSPTTIPKATATRRAAAPAQDNSQSQTTKQEGEGLHFHDE